MFWSFLSWLYQHFDWSVTTVAVICGAWNFWFEGPALAERGFAAEARLAAWGGVAMMAGAVAIFVTLQIVSAYLAL